MLHIIFWEPEIPGNTGAAIRLSACTGSMLHLVKPLGFDMDDAKLRRAGLDYHDLAHVKVHDSLDEALAEVPGRIWALTGHATTMYSDVTYADGDGLLFGRESVGLSEDAMNHPRVDRPVRGVAPAGFPERRLTRRQICNERGPGRITRWASFTASIVGLAVGQCALHEADGRSTCSASETILRGFERHIQIKPMIDTMRGRK